MTAFASKLRTLSVLNYLSLKLPENIRDAFPDVFTHFYVAKNVSSFDVHKTLIPHFQTMMDFSPNTDMTLKTSNNIIIRNVKYNVLSPVKAPFDYTMALGSEPSPFRSAKALNSQSFFYAYILHLYFTESERWNLLQRFHDYLSEKTT
jgi:hypothetical protein